MDEIVQPRPTFIVAPQGDLILNHGTYSNAEPAEHMEESPANVANHVRELLDVGSIEIAEEKRRGNRLVAILRTVSRPELAAMNAQLPPRPGGQHQSHAPESRPHPR